MWGLQKLVTPPYLESRRKGVFSADEQIKTWPVEERKESHGLFLPVEKETAACISPQTEAAKHDVGNYK